jgi:peptidoglycan/xylan/chitin deacetylase (PgdA/CDA1 family)
MEDDSAHRTPQYIPVLMYHNVEVHPPRADDPLTVSASLFEEHLAALRDSGWETGLVRDIPSQRVGGSKKATYITFDDAFETFGSVVAPCLEASDANATVFVPTAFLGQSAEWPFSGETASRLKVMSLQSLSDLDPARVEIGGHGHQHFQSDLISSTTLRSEFQRSREILEQGLGRSIGSMAYPFGYHDRRARRIAREVGYTRACEVGLGLHALGRGRDLCIRRLFITPEATPEGLVQLMEEGQRSEWRSALYSAARPAWREVRRIKRALHRSGEPDAAAPKESR